MFTAQVRRKKERPREKKTVQTKIKSIVSRTHTLRDITSLQRQEERVIKCVIFTSLQRQEERVTK